MIGANGDETDFKWPAKLSNLRELRVARQVVEAWAELLHVLWHGAVTAVGPQRCGSANGAQLTASCVSELGTLFVDLLP